MKRKGNIYRRLIEQKFHIKSSDEVSEPLYKLKTTNLTKGDKAKKEVDKMKCKILLITVGLMLATVPCWAVLLTGVNFSGDNFGTIPDAGTIATQASMNDASESEIHPEAERIKNEILEYMGLTTLEGDLADVLNEILAVPPDAEVTQSENEITFKWDQKSLIVLYHNGEIENIWFNDDTSGNDHWIRMDFRRSPNEKIIDQESGEAIKVDIVAVRGSYSPEAEGEDFIQYYVKGNANAVAEISGNTEIPIRGDFVGYLGDLSWQKEASVNKDISSVKEYLTKLKEELEANLGVEASNGSRLDEVFENLSSLLDEETEVVYTKFSRSYMGIDAIQEEYKFSKGTIYVVKIKDPNTGEIKISDISFVPSKLPYPSLIIKTYPTVDNEGRENPMYVTVKDKKPAEIGLLILQQIGSGEDNPLLGLSDRERVDFLAQGNTDPLLTLEQDSWLVF